MGTRGPVLVASLIGSSFALTCIVKDYMSGKIYEKESDLKDKVYIITGANSGIGYGLTTLLAVRKATVYMACRDLKKCEEARREVVLDTKNKYIYCRECDLSSFESIKHFVETFKAEQDNLNGLINNAGVMMCPRSVTKDGIEMQLGVNHMGHFLLTNLLLDNLKKTAPSRVVVVTGDAHLKGKINLTDLNSEESYDPTTAYNQSKLANMLFVNELSSQLLGTGVTAHAANPGITSTNLTRHLDVTKSISRHILDFLFWPFTKPVARAAQNILFVAVDPDIQKDSGKYYTDLKEDKISDDGKNIELAKWLWAVSEKWTKIK